jgi:signal transduction histidine kinase
MSSPTDAADRHRDFARAGADWTWCVDADLRIADVSDGIVLAVGRAPTTLVGQPLSVLGRLLDGPGGEPPIVRASRDSAPFRGQLMETSQGLHCLDGTPIIADGVLAGFRGFGRAARSTAPELTSDRFVAAMSHELRTPLTAIIGFAEAMALGTHGPLHPHYEDYARDIASAGRHLMSMLEDLLDGSPATAEPARLDRVAFDLAEVLEQARTMVDLRAAARRISLDSALQRPQLAVLADRRRVLQILVNLLTNAVKFTPEGGRVRLGVERSAAGVRITVDDTGPGVADADRERIFGKFARGDGVEAEGSGLGLHISRDLARRMNGDLSVDAAPTGGARFVLTLPAA